MNNCRDESEYSLPLEDLVESYSFEDARTGYNGLSVEAHEIMNNALNEFLRSRGKFHSMKEILKQEYQRRQRRHGKN